MSHSLEQSLKARLRNISRELSIDPAVLWQNLVLERFLIRLCRSRFAPHFILKGGSLLTHYVPLGRHTRDLDFLVHKLNHRPEHLHAAFEEIISLPVGDGFSFSQLQVDPLTHPHMKYQGVRAQMLSQFARARFKVVVDLGYGDRVVPITRSLPLMSSCRGALFESHVQIQCYPQEFIFAEKLEAIVYHAGHNSRMKDFHDLYVMIKANRLNKRDLNRIVRSVFRHRQTKLAIPLEFASADRRIFQQLWTAHCRGLPASTAIPSKFDLIINTINAWLTASTNLCQADPHKQD